MSEPWFNGDQYGWIIGVTMAAAGAATAILTAKLAPKARGRRFMVVNLYSQFVISVLLVAVGLIGRFSGQPYSVWFAVFLPGLIGVVVLSVMIPRTLRTYRQAQQRRLAES